MLRYSAPRGHRILLAASLACAVGSAAAVPAVAVPDTADERDYPTMMIVMDASGSMDEPSGSGGTRMEAAGEAFGQVVDAMPAEAQVGLRVFGGGTSGVDACEDSRLAVPVGPVDAPALAEAMAELEPSGDTPLAYSMEHAAGDLPAEGQRIIVVISDGEETCGGQACEVAGRLVEDGIDVRIDVIGFQVDSAARDELGCIADAGGGTFYDAPDAESLAAQLQRVAVRGLRVFTPDGIPVSGTPAAQGAPVIEDGRYLDDLVGPDPLHYQVDVSDGATLWVAATVRPMLSGLASATSVEVEVLSVDGTRCAWNRESAIGAWAASLPLMSSVRAGDADLERCGDGPYTLQVEQAQAEPGEARALELLVGHEPAVTTTDGLPARASDADWDVELTSGSAPVEPVTGSPNIASATLVGPGRYSDTILIGETQFFAVELDWGQQLVCEPTLGASAAVAQGLEGVRPTAWTRVFGPYRGELTRAHSGSTYSGTADVTLSESTPPVRYLNREHFSTDAAAVAGTYYCAVTLEGDAEDAGVGEVPLELAIDVLGEAGAGAPAYLEQTEPEPTPTAAEAAGQPAGDPDEQAEEESEDEEAAQRSDGMPSWLPVAVAFALGLVVAAVAVLLVVRRNRVAPAEDGDPGRQSPA